MKKLIPLLFLLAGPAFAQQYARTNLEQPLRLKIQQDELTDYIIRHEQECRHSPVQDVLDTLSEEEKQTLFSCTFHSEEEAMLGLNTLREFKTLQTQWKRYTRQDYVQMTRDIIDLMMVYNQLRTANPEAAETLSPLLVRPIKLYRGAPVSIPEHLQQNYNVFYHGLNMQLEDFTYHLLEDYSSWCEKHTFVDVLPGVFD